MSAPPMDYVEFTGHIILDTCSRNPYFLGIRSYQPWL